MPFFHLAISLLSVIGSVTGAKVSISQVSSVVSLATSSFAPAVTYAGPTGSASSVSAKSSTTKVSPQVVAATAAAAPYWLESITHQGISAFNSNPASYQVFRNVKSFGAKGKNSAVICELQFSSNRSQAMVLRTIQLQSNLQCRRVDAVHQVAAHPPPQPQPLYISLREHT